MKAGQQGLSSFATLHEFRLAQPAQLPTHK